MEVKPSLLIQSSLAMKDSQAASEKEQQPSGMRQMDLFTFAKGTVKADVVDLGSERDFPALGGKFAAP